MPFCLIAFFIGVKLLRESRDETAPRTVDYLGAVLAVTGVALLTLVIVQSNEWGWVSTRSLVLLGVAVSILVAFMARCNAAAHPVLDLHLFKLPFVTAAALSGFVFTMDFFSMIFVNTQWLQMIWHYSPSRSGLAVAPGPIMAAIVVAPAGRLAQRVGHGRVIAAGSLIMATGITLLNLRITETPHYWGMYFPIFAYTGIGVGLCISTISSSATAFLPQPKFAMGSALNNTARQIDAALGVAVVSSMLVSVSKLDDPIAGFHRAWTFIIVAVLLAGVAMLTLFRRPTAAQLEAAI